MDSLVDRIVFTPAVESHKIARQWEAGRLEAESKWAAGGESAGARNETGNSASPGPQSRPQSRQARAAGPLPGLLAWVVPAFASSSGGSHLTRWKAPKSRPASVAQPKTRRDSKQEAQAVSIEHPLRCPLSLHARPLFYFTARSQPFSKFCFRHYHITSQSTGLFVADLKAQSQFEAISPSPLPHHHLIHTPRHRASTTPTTLPVTNSR